MAFSRGVGTSSWPSRAASGVAGAARRVSGPAGAGHSRRRRRRAGVATRRRPAFYAARRVAHVARPAAPRRAGVPSRRARRRPARAGRRGAAGTAAFVAFARGAAARLGARPVVSAQLGVLDGGGVLGGRAPGRALPGLWRRRRSEARGRLPRAGCALGAAWLAVVTCPAPGGASAAATTRRDIMRVIN